MSKINELYGAISGLFLIYGISTDCYTGKVIINRLKEIETQLTKLRKQNKNLKAKIKELKEQQNDN